MGVWGLGFILITVLITILGHRVNSIKLEHGLRTISAGIPFSNPLGGLRIMMFRLLGVYCTPMSGPQTPHERKDAASRVFFGIPRYGGGGGALIPQQQDPSAWFLEGPPKVVDLEVPLNALLIWPLDVIRDPYTGGPKPKGTTSRVQGRTPRPAAWFA